MTWIKCLILQQQCKNSYAQCTYCARQNSCEAMTNLFENDSLTFIYKPQIPCPQTALSKVWKYLKFISFSGPWLPSAYPRLHCCWGPILISSTLWVHEFMSQSRQLDLCFSSTSLATLLHGHTMPILRKPRHYSSQRSGISTNSHTVSWSHHFWSWGTGDTFLLAEWHDFAFLSNTDSNFG